MIPFCLCTYFVWNEQARYYNKLAAAYLQCNKEWSRSSTGCWTSTPHNEQQLLLTAPTAMLPIKPHHLTTQSAASIASRIPQVPDWNQQHRKQKILPSAHNEAVPKFRHIQCPRLCLDACLSVPIEPSLDQICLVTRKVNSRDPETKSLFHWYRVISVHVTREY